MYYSVFTRSLTTTILCILVYTSGEINSSLIYFIFIWEGEREGGREGREGGRKGGREGGEGGREEGREGGRKGECNYMYMYM